MKATGIVRPMDALGRVVIPIELRRNLSINTDDSLEVFVDGEIRTFYEGQIQKIDLHRKWVY